MPAAHWNPRSCDQHAAVAARSTESRTIRPTYMLSTTTPSQRSEVAVTVKNPAPPNMTIAVLAGAGIVASLMQTLVVPLIGDLPALLHTSSANASWVLTATLLAGAVATPVIGRLGDLFGKKRMLLVCVALLAVGSVVCGLSSSLVPMVVGRALQGVGMGIIPLGISTMRDVIPQERLGSAVALMSSSLGIGGALGLPIAAVVAQSTDWHVLFWGTAVLSVLVGLMIFALVPYSEPSTTGRFDAVGAVTLALGLICLLLAVSKGDDWGWSSPITLSLFGGCVAILGSWAWWELHTHDPLIDLRTVARKQVLFTNFASVAIGFAMYAQSLVVPQLLQLPKETGYGLGQSMLATGLWMAPAGLVMMALSPVGAFVSKAKGPKISLLLGALIIAVGYACTPVLMGTTWGLLVFTCISSTGVAFAYGAMPSLIMGAVPPGETAAANGFNALMRSVGSSISSAVVGVVLASTSITIGDQIIPTNRGFQLAFFIGCTVALIAAAITIVIPRRTIQTDALPDYTSPQPIPATPPRL